MGFGILLHITPRLTRPGVFFGVTVPPEFRGSAEARRIVRRFRALLWAFTAMALALAVVLGMNVLALLCQLAGFLCGFISARREAQAHATTDASIREVDLSAPPETLPGGPVVLLLPILFLAALAVWAGSHWDVLPSRFPVHWGFHGADRWVDRTPATVYGFLAVHAAVCLMLAAVAWGLMHWSRHIVTAGAGAVAERRFRRRIALLLVVSEYLLVGPAWIALFQPAPVAMNIWGLALAATLVGFLVNLIVMGQGGSRLAASADAGDHTPDSCWKFGLFYINPADPAILIEKRFGIGYTVNLGNRWSWLVMALMLSPALLALLFLK
jgi:uncharacterized membrane protein